MPQIDDQDDAVLVGAVPGLVLKAIVEDKALALLPRSRVVLHADGAVSVGHPDTEVASHAQIRGAGVSADVRTCPHARYVPEAGHREDGPVALYPARSYRAGFADLVAAPAALVKERHIPIPDRWIRSLSR